MCVCACACVLEKSVGSLCTPDNTECVAGAACIDGTCACRPGVAKAYKVYCGEYMPLISVCVCVCVCGGGGVFVGCVRVHAPVSYLCVFAGCDRVIVW